MTIVLQIPRGGSELQPGELGAALDAAAHAERPVILTVLGDG